MLTEELNTGGRVPLAFIEPMQVASVRELPDGGRWTYEVKFDGYRCLASKRSTGVVLWSRRGNGFTTRFPEIARACQKLPADTLIDEGLNQPPINPIPAGPASSNDVIHLNVEHVRFNGDSKERPAPRAVPGYIVDHKLRVTLPPGRSSRPLLGLKSLEPDPVIPFWYP